MASRPANAPTCHARPHLTGRDKYAASLEDMFDFDTSPSLETAVGHAAPPVTDCTPKRVGP